MASHTEPAAWVTGVPHFADKETETQLLTQDHTASKRWGIPRSCVCQGKQMKWCMKCFPPQAPTSKLQEHVLGSDHGRHLGSRRPAGQEIDRELHPREEVITGRYPLEASCARPFRASTDVWGAPHRGPGDNFYWRLRPGFRARAAQPPLTGHISHFGHSQTTTPE